MVARSEPLRIALVAPPVERVPPTAYGGTERVVHALAGELTARGHRVTVFGSGDSDVPGELVATAPRALRVDGWAGDATPWIVATQLAVLDAAERFDIIHSHIDWSSLILGHRSPVPVVATFHGRIDLPGAREALASTRSALVAISNSQASMQPDAPWAAVVHNGLDLSGAPFGTSRTDDLCFVGRLMPEKGILDAVEIARLAGRRLYVAAKVGTTPAEVGYFRDVVAPAFAGADVEHLGELSSPDRDLLFARSHATVMPGTWPEPFGLVAIESLACGTPVLATRAGALPEIVRDGIDGFLGDDNAQLAAHVGDVGHLDRAAVRASVLERFSAGRMASGYEAVYRRAIQQNR